MIMLINRLVSIIYNVSRKCFNRRLAERSKEPRSKGIARRIQNCASQYRGCIGSNESLLQFRTKGKKEDKGLEVSPFTFSLLFFLTIMIVYTVFQELGYFSYYQCYDTTISIDECIQRFNNIGVYR